MKLLIPSLLLGLMGYTVRAQEHYLFTLTELQRLVSCPDKACFRKAVVARGYEFREAKTSTLEGVQVNSYLYYVLSRGEQPYRPQYLITFSDGGAVYRSVYFLTLDALFPAWLDTHLAAEGYRPTGQTDPGEDRQYVREDGGLLWTLTRNKPGFSPAQGKATYSIILTSKPKPAEQPTQAVVDQPLSDEPAHLGGNWDSNYPSQNVADIVKAERRYAADYEQKNGKVGHTFDRVEKMRIQAKRLGQYRLLTDDRWGKSFESALRMTGFAAFADDRLRLYKREALFDVAGERVWMPIQEILTSTLEKESRIGQPVTLYAVLVSHHDYGGTLHLSFLINEFAASKVNTSATSPPAVNTTTPARSDPRAVASAPAASPRPEDFMQFVKQFSADKAFQLSRIQFPLVWKEETGNETIVHRNTRSDWEYYSILTEESDIKVYVNKPTAQKTVDASVQRTCVAACGFADTLRFKRINGKWYCVARSVINN